MDNLDWNVIHSACQGQHLSIPRSLGRLNIHWNVSVSAKILSEWFYDMTALHMAASLSDSHILGYVLDPNHMTDTNAIGYK